MQNERKPLVVPEGMTKSAYKKQLRRERSKERWKLKKERKKRLRKEARLKQSEQPVKKAKLSEDEKRIMEQKKLENIKEREAKRQEYLRKVQNGQRVVIDLAFESKMSEKEVKSNVQQIMYSYGCNKRSSVPFNITLCDFHGKTQMALEKVSGFEQWSLQKDSKPYIEVFKKEELVYLTADSPNTIHSLDPTKVYVVGGIVDRNRYKGLTFDKATRQGIQTAKLPIGNFLKLSSTKVLTTNHVLSIMIHFNESKDWSDAFQKVLPMRKKWSVKASSKIEKSSETNATE